MPSVPTRGADSSPRMTDIAAVMGLDRGRFVRLADGLAVACAVALPWSTSISGILIVVWLIALIPILNVAAVRRELLTAAGGLPVLLWLLAVAGLAWSDASLTERLGGLGSFHKLLAIPLLLAQFRKSGNGKRVIWGFFASCLILLFTSYAHVLFEEKLSWLFTRTTQAPGVPVRDYILQSGEFQLCIFGIAYAGVDACRSGRRGVALALAVLALAFLADIVFVVTSRTALAVMPALLVLFGLRQFGWKGSVALAAGGVALAGILRSGPVAPATGLDGSPDNPAYH